MSPSTLRPSRFSIASASWTSLWAVSAIVTDMPACWGVLENPGNHGRGKASDGDLVRDKAEHSRLARLECARRAIGAVAQLLRCSLDLVNR